MPSIHVITFDLDDTLWPVAPVLAGAERTLYDWLRAEAPQLTERYDIQGLREHRLALLERQPALRHHISDWRRLSLQQVLREAGHGQERAAALAEQALAVFLEARHRVELFEGARETLQALSARYRLGAITNGNADVFRLDIGELFDFAVRAEEIGRSKPDSGIFRQALQRGGCAPEQTLHIGDDPVNDIAAAREAGLHTLQARLLGEPQAAECPGFHHWHEVPALLEALGGRRD